MNYILEGNSNFNEILMEAVCSNDDNSEKCLISNKPLDDNYITLECKHKFNYNEIFKEVCKQKKNPNILEVQKLKPNEIKCPYCRYIQTGILPYCHDAIKMNNVNWPPKNAFSFNHCTYKQKFGKNKGNECGIKCLKNHCWKHSQKKASTLICKGIIKSGKRKGQQCQYSAKKGEFCKIHTVQKDNKQN